MMPNKVLHSSSKHALIIKTLRENKFSRKSKSVDTTQNRIEEFGASCNKEAPTIL